MIPQHSTFASSCNFWQLSSRCLLKVTLPWLAWQQQALAAMSWKMTSVKTTRTQAVRSPERATFGLYCACQICLPIVPASGSTRLVYRIFCWTDTGQRQASQVSCDSSLICTVNLIHSAVMPRLSSAARMEVPGIVASTRPAEYSICCSSNACRTTTRHATLLSQLHTCIYQLQPVRALLIQDTQ